MWLLIAYFWNCTVWFPVLTSRPQEPVSTDTFGTAVQFIQIWDQRCLLKHLLSWGYARQLNQERCTEALQLLPHLAKCVYLCVKMLKPDILFPFAIWECHVIKVCCFEYYRTSVIKCEHVKKCFKVSCWLIVKSWKLKKIFKKSMCTEFIDSHVKLSAAV